MLVKARTNATELQDTHTYLALAGTRFNHYYYLLLLIFRVHSVLF